MKMKYRKKVWLAVLVVLAFLLFGGCGLLIRGKNVRENVVNYSPEVFREINQMRANDADGNCLGEVAPLKPWEKQFCLKNKNTCYKNNAGPIAPFPQYDIGGPGCVAPYSKTCQENAIRGGNFPESYYPCGRRGRRRMRVGLGGPPGVSEGFNNPKKKDDDDENKEEFLDWSMYNPPISNGFTPNWWPTGTPWPAPGALGPGGGGAYAMPQLAYQNALDRIYNPLRYPYRSEAFYEQGWYPNMTLPPQVIGCGGRRQGCLGGTESAVPNVPPPIEISERNIAPVNIMTRGPQGIPQQVGLLYKIFGSLNEVYPLYGRKKYPNSDTWDYYTQIGKNRDLKIPVITRRKNNNELGTNDVVQIAGNSARFRVTVYDHDFPQYVPYA